MSPKFALKALLAFSVGVAGVSGLQVNKEDCAKVCQKILKKTSIETGGSPFNILDVDEGADDAAVKKAFRTLSRQVHPDKCPHAAEAATQAFQAVNAANECLTNEMQRMSYEMYGHCGASAGSQYYQNNSSDSTSHGDDPFPWPRLKKIAQFLDMVLSIVIIYWICRGIEFCVRKLCCASKSAKEDNLGSAKENEDDIEAEFLLAARTEEKEDNIAMESDSDTDSSDDAEDFFQDSRAADVNIVNVAAGTNAQLEEATAAEIAAEKNSEQEPTAAAAAAEVTSETSRKW